MLAHLLELLTQAAERFRLLGMSVELENGTSKAHIESLFPLSDVVDATIQTMQGARLLQWPRDAFDTIIVDEFHHAVSPMYRAALEHFIGCKILGVTATPDRGDGIAAGNVIDHKAYEYGLRTAIDDGFLVPLLAEGVDTPIVDVSSIRTTAQAHGRDYSAEDLARLMTGEEAMHALARPIIEKSGKRSTLVFVPSVAVAYELARVLSAHLAELGQGPAEALDGGSSHETKEQVKARFRAGRTRIMINCALFTEGFDAPICSCVAIARPTKCRSLYAQMVGRGTRLSDATAKLIRDPRLTAEQRRVIVAASDKPDCLILDLAPSNIGRHDLAQVADLLAGGPLPDDVRREARTMDGSDVLAKVKRAEEIAKSKEAARAKDRGRIVADVHYRSMKYDPFTVSIGMDVKLGEKGPRASEAQIAAIKDAGLKLPTTPSRREASEIMDRLALRRKRGLCTIKQGRILARAGLPADLPFVEARLALDALAAAGWQTTPEILARWGGGPDDGERWER